MIAIILISASVSFICVAIHILAFRGLGQFLFHQKELTYSHVGLMILCSIAAHLVEIIIFQITYLILVTSSDRFGTIQGDGTVEGADAFYFSAVTYTSLGYGDLVPVGLLRILATVETLTGLILIAWTASFVLIVMQRYWEKISGVQARVERGEGRGKR